MTERTVKEIDQRQNVLGVARPTADIALPVGQLDDLLRWSISTLRIVAHLAGTVSGGSFKDRAVPQRRSTPCCHQLR